MSGSGGPHSQQPELKHVRLARGENQLQGLGVELKATELRIPRMCLFLKAEPRERSGVDSQLYLGQWEAREGFLSRERI